MTKKYKSTTNLSQKVHFWLRRFYGYPSVCEHCPKKGSFVKNRWSICWALKKGKRYSKKRENFLSLCAKCHTAYDMDDKWRANIGKARRKGRRKDICKNGHKLNIKNLYVQKVGNITRRTCRVCNRALKEKAKLLK